MMKKIIRYDQAHTLMDRRDARRRPVPFHIKWRTVDGRVVEADVDHTVSYDRRKGSRRLILSCGAGFRNIYDVLILQIDDTLVVVS